MIPGDWDWGKDPIGPAIRRPPLAVLINTSTWCGWWMMVWFQWSKAAILYKTSKITMDVYISTIARCSAIETHWRRHLFFQRSSSSSMFLGPGCQSCGSCESRFHLIPLNLEQRWIISPSHCIQCHGIRRNICPLGVWLPRSSCWWACHPTRIALARLKAIEASPIQSTGIYSHLDSVRLWNTSLHSPSRKRLHAITEGWLQHPTSGWDHQKLPLARTPAPEKYSAHLRLRKVRFRKPVRGVNESQHASFVKPARKMISNIDYPIISHLSNMPTFFWAKPRQIRGADTPRGRNVPGKEAGQRQTKWHTVWCAISICHTWPRR